MQIDADSPFVGYQVMESKAPIVLAGRVMNAEVGLHVPASGSFDMIGACAIDAGSLVPVEKLSAVRTGQCR